MPEGVIGFYELVPPNHHLNWNKAFDKAIEEASRELEPGEIAPFDVQFEVNIRHTSPGWADGYKVVLTRK